MSRRRVLLVGTLLVVIVFGLLTDRWFVHPRIDEPGQADAIFVLGGGGPRVDYAVDLARDGTATEVVFASSFVESENVWAAGPCNGSGAKVAGVEFTCVEPEPKTTRGEARLLRRLAAEEGWDNVVVVASTDQITRARRLIGRCWDGEVQMVGVSHDQSWPLRALYEWGASAKATFLRGC